MELFVALLIGLLAGIGCYLILSRNLFRILLGLALIAQAANVLVFAAAGLGDGTTAVIPETADGPSPEVPDPLAQALVLTAIVISFGVIAFCLTLFKRTQRRSDRSDISILSDSRPK